MKQFGELACHAGRHPTWPFVFNPYDQRPTHLLGKGLFNAILGAFPQSCDFALDHLFTGLIDALEKLPMGSTECVRTIGGWEREEYNTQRRECEDWRAAAKAAQGTAAMLKKILEELEE